MPFQVAEASSLLPTGLSVGGAICVRADASAHDLHDEALLRSQAVAGVISVGLSAPLHELNADLLNGYLQAIQLLVEESSYLSNRAYELLASPQSASSPSVQANRI